MVPSGVVEVDHEADAAAGHPDADPDPVVRGVHQVDVVAAAVRLLALEEEMRGEHGGAGAARPAADVLRPAVAGVAGRGAARSPGLPPMKWLHSLLIASFLAYGRLTFELIPLSSLSGATFRPPGLLQAPVEVTQPPVRVQFIRPR